MFEIVESIIKEKERHSREIDDIRKYQKEILELKNTVTNKQTNKQKSPLDST